MARTVGTASVADLIKAKALKRNETLVIHRRSKPDITASVQRDGSILLDGTVYPTPSAAAREALDVGSADGWIRWRVPRLNDATLASVRDSQS